MIRVEHLRKAFMDSCPLEDISFEVNEGDVIAIIGPSGTGKSTLLRSLNLLSKPSSGQIFIGDEEITSPSCDIDKLRTRVGMVFQSFNVFNNMTVIENVMMPQVDNMGRSKQEAYDKAISLLKKVGMEGKEYQYPDVLSGGQKQRVAIARTLAMDPEVILFDEPTSALDPTMTGEVESVIYDLAQEGRTMIIVTHEMQFARNVSNRVLYIDDGVIYEEGTPEEIFENPKKEKTIAFIRQLKTLELEFVPKHFDYASESEKVTEYIKKNHISARTSYKIISAMEELNQEILAPILGDNRILFSVEYEGATGEARITIMYAGPRFNPADTDNELSYSIVAGLCSSIEYSYDKKEEYSNKIHITV